MPDTTGVLSLPAGALRFAAPGYQPRFGPVFGRVLARLTVDTLGRVEPGSIVITQSDNPALSLAMCDDLLAQRFEPYRADGMPHRVRAGLNLRMGQAPAGH